MSSTKNETGLVCVTQWTCSQIGNQTFAKGRIRLQADKIIQHGERKKKLATDKDENHVEPLQPPTSIPTQYQSLRLNKSTK